MICPQENNEIGFHIGTVSVYSEHESTFKALISFGRRVKLLINVNTSSVIIK